MYFDPPYPNGLRGEAFDPVKYQAGGFGVEDHRRLAAQLRRLDQRGVLFMLSNSDSAFTRELLSGFRIDALSVRRHAGGHAGRRGGAREIVIRNYERFPDTLQLAGAG